MCEYIFKNSLKFEAIVEYTKGILSSNNQLVHNLQHFHITVKTTTAQAYLIKHY